MRSVDYFAFGANMSSVVLRRRRIQVLSREPARLRGYRLVFDLAGVRWVEPAFASIVPDAEHDVYGVLYRLTPEQAQRLDSFEGRGYLIIQVEVEGERSGATRCRTYQTRRPVPGLRPSRRYLQILRKGARENGLPPAYVRDLAAQPAVYVPVVSEIVDRGIGLFEAAEWFLGRVRAR